VICCVVTSMEESEARSPVGYVRGCTDEKQQHV